MDPCRDTLDLDEADRLAILELIELALALDPDTDSELWDLLEAA